MRQLLLRSGYSPMEVLVKREDLVTLWVQRQAAVEAFNETFVFAGLIITIGIVPALGIRKVSYPVLAKPIVVASGLTVR